MARIEKFLLPLPSKSLCSLNTVTRLNRWEREALKKPYQDSVRWELHQLNTTPFVGKVYVEYLMKLRCSKAEFQQRDGDNCCYIIKLALDEVVRAGIIKDDSFEFIEPIMVISFDYEPDKTKEGFLLIRVSDVPLYCGEIIRREFVD